MNGSVRIGPQDCSNDLMSMVTTEANLPRSETIASFGHHSYTDDLSTIHGQQENPGNENEGNEGDADFCRKCGHCMKKE